MNLEQLLEGIPGVRWPGEHAGLKISALSCDSREDQQGGLFFALNGFKFRGADFVSAALAAGAAAVVVDEAACLPADLERRAVVVRASDPPALLRAAASRFYGSPSRQVATIGITGTNGKTTFTYVMESIARAAGKTCGVIGTVNYRVNGEVLPARNTTPGFLQTQRLLAAFRQRGAVFCLMEVSSHALHQGRVDGIDFKAAVFSNLTQDHLDYHPSMEDYFQAKALLFTRLPAAVPAVINADDPYGRRLIAMTTGRPVTYGIDMAADVRAADLRWGLEGTAFNLVFPDAAAAVKTALVGRHNVYNILSAAACAFALGFDRAAIKSGIEALSCVPGRLERVPTARGFEVFIDYAHTQDGLANVLTALRALSKTRVIVVFGCGGDRDRGKRPKMGAAVCAGADHAIITSDNPRSEDPLAIIRDILPGFTSLNYEVCPDRREAIARALAAAREGDIVLLAGKGHEDYQVLKEGTIPFNERAIIQECLRV